MLSRLLLRTFFLSFFFYPVAAVNKLLISILHTTFYYWRNLWPMTPWYGMTAGACHEYGGHRFYNWKMSVGYIGYLAYFEVSRCHRLWLFSHIRAEFRIKLSLSIRKWRDLKLSVSIACYPMPVCACSCYAKVDCWTILFVNFVFFIQSVLFQKPESLKTSAFSHILVDWVLCWVNFVHFLIDCESTVFTRLNWVSFFPSLP